MTKLFLDTETYCDLSIKDVGVKKYVNHPSFHILCCAYAFDDGPVHIWRQGNNPSVLWKAITDPEIKILAYNAEFDMRVLQATWPSAHLTSAKFIDVMAVACACGYSLSLDKFCIAIGAEYKKNKDGVRLINKLCIEQKQTAFNPDGKWTPETAPEDFKKLYKYCMDDVEAMRSAYKLLPREDLPAMETLIWRHTLSQNDRGLPVDIQTVKTIRIMLNIFNKELKNELSELTNGQVTTGKQVKRIREFLDYQGVSVPNLQAHTVADLLDKGGLPPVAMRVLEIRQLLAMSSTAKFDKLYAMNLEDRVHGNLRYHWAHTGRFAGRGFQIHNLPRAKHENPEEVIELLRECDYDKMIEKFPKLNEAASALIRPIVCAPKGKKLIVADYTSVENVFLHWAAGDSQTTEDFRNGVDQYKRYASRRFKVDYDEVTKEQRTYAKPCVLGLGYGGAEGALMRVAHDYGLTLSPKEAQIDVDFYRRKLYPMIPKFWYAVFNKAKAAIKSREPQILITKTTQFEFRYAGGYLFIILPSGRRISYPQARADDEWGVEVKGKSFYMSAQISYMGLKENAWLRLDIHPGLMTENIIQAMARDYLCYGCLCVEQGGYPVIATVHDEVICETPDNNDYTIEELVSLFCTPQNWSKDVPVSADGYEGYRYKKD